MRALLGFVVWLATTMVMAFPDGNTLSNEEPTEVPRNDSEEMGAMEQCDEIMANNGLNFSSFWHGAAQTILFNSPLRGYIKTMALKVMAFFMLNDKPDFYQQVLKISKYL